MTVLATPVLVVPDATVAIFLAIFVALIALVGFLVELPAMDALFDNLNARLCERADEGPTLDELPARLNAVIDRKG